RASCFILTVTVAAALSFSGCSSCDRGSETRPPASPPTTLRSTTPAPPARTTSTVPVVRDQHGRYALFRPSKAQVGDVVTMDSDTTRTGHFTKTGADGSRTALPPVLDVLHVQWVETVSAVDGDGN